MPGTTRIEAISFELPELNHTVARAQGRGERLIGLFPPQLTSLQRQTALAHPTGADA